MAQGKVKWFDARRGYGFVSDEAGDVFLHRRILQKIGLRRIEPGRRVEFEYELTPRGRKAIWIRLLPPSQDP